MKRTLVLQEEDDKDVQHQNFLNNFEKKFGMSLHDFKSHPDTQERFHQESNTISYTLLGVEAKITPEYPYWSVCELHPEPCDIIDK